MHVHRGHRDPHPTSTSTAATRCLDDVEGNDGRGIHVTAPIDVALKNVRVHGCDIRHFLNNVRISREGFKTLAEGTRVRRAAMRTSSSRNSRPTDSGSAACS